MANLTSFIPELLTASGPFDFPMTNNYIFRAVLQSNNKGQDYSRIKPVTHIGILNSAPSYEGEEFYSQNMLMNVKSYKIYSDKLSLHVLNLNQIRHATSEDKAWGIDKWAALFKADTWETIKMISQNNEYLTEASNTIFRMNADDMARKRAQDREDYYRDIRTWKRDIEELKTVVEDQKSVIAEKDAALKKQAALIAELRSQIADNFIKTYKVNL